MIWVPAATAHGVSTVGHWMLPSPKQLSFKLSLKWSQHFLVTPTVFLPFEFWGQTLPLKVLQESFHSISGFTFQYSARRMIRNFGVPDSFGKITRRGKGGW